MSKEEEYKELFLVEANESCEQLNRLFTELEKNASDQPTIDAIFRITHTLKGNAMGMGFEAIAELSHVMEDVFNEVKTGQLSLSTDLFTTLFKANDILGLLITALTSGEVVRYKGIKTKLEVALRNAKTNRPAQTVAATDREETVAAVTYSEEQDFDADATDDNAPQLALSDVVQVPVRKLDHLLNMIGELIIERDSLIARNLERGFPASDLARLQRITSDLQYGVMDVRLVQVGFLFSKFHRIVRDVLTLEQKKADLKLIGTEIEIDRNVLRIMSDSLVHLIRNAASHGIELPEQRILAGKPEAGKITLAARSEKDTIFIDVSDDGNGIDVSIIRNKAIEKGMVQPEHAAMLSDAEVLMYIFEPGFSSAAAITSVSGRGVGMDVVKRAVESIGGRINIQSVLGKGTTITLALPSSLAVKGALLFELQHQLFAIALSHTDAVISLHKSDIHKINNGLIADYLGKTIAVFFLKDLFFPSEHAHSQHPWHHTYDELTADAQRDVIIVSYNNRLAGIVVDKVVQQKEIVEKNLARPIEHTHLFSGATIMGNGEVCLVLNIIGILSDIWKDKTTELSTHTV